MDMNYNKHASLMVIFLDPDLRLFITKIRRKRICWLSCWRIVSCYKITIFTQSMFMYRAVQIYMTIKLTETFS